jgi:citrate lyase beta subunit
MEDSVPPDEKPKARAMIRDKLLFLRSNTFSPRVVITPRTNGLATGLFEDDVKGVLCQENIDAIDGFCVPKVDTEEEYRKIDGFLKSQERAYSLEEGHFKLIP